jgi:hypothetical protein
VALEVFRNLTSLIKHASGPGADRCFVMVRKQLWLPLRLKIAAPRVGEGQQQTRQRSPSALLYALSSELGVAWLDLGPSTEFRHALCIAPYGKREDSPFLSLALQLFFFLSQNSRDACMMRVQLEHIFIHSSIHPFAVCVCVCVCCMWPSEEVGGGLGRVVSEDSSTHSGARAVGSCMGGVGRARPAELSSRWCNSTFSVAIASSSRNKNTTRE